MTADQRLRFSEVALKRLYPRTKTFSAPARSFYRNSEVAERYWDAEYEPEFDLVLISQIIHGLSYSQCDKLIKRSVNALAPGGRMLVHDGILSEDRTFPYHASLFSVYMLATTERGRSYTFNEVREWMTNAGLSDIRRIEIDTDSEIIEGVK